MQRRGFLKFLGMAAAAPVVAPIAAKCLRAEQTNPELQKSEADKWRELCGYGRNSAATQSMVVRDFNPFIFKAGDIVTIGDDPMPLVITKTYSHGETS